MRANVMTMTKKTTGIIHRMRRTMKTARLPARLSVMAERRPGSRAPRLGRPAITAKLLPCHLVLCDVGVVPEEVAGKALVVACGDGKPTNVRLDQVVLVVLVDEGDGGLVDQLVLRLLVVGVALALVE